MEGIQSAPVEERIEKYLQQIEQLENSIKKKDTEIIIFTHSLRALQHELAELYRVRKIDLIRAQRLYNRNFANKGNQLLSIRSDCLHLILSFLEDLELVKLRTVCVHLNRETLKVFKEVRYPAQNQMLINLPYPNIGTDQLRILSSLASPPTIVLTGLNFFFGVMDNKISELPWDKLKTKLSSVEISPRTQNYEGNSKKVIEWALKFIEDPQIFQNCQNSSVVVTQLFTWARDYINSQRNNEFKIRKFIFHATSP
eukprot:TRINITY_DN2529_c0_g5_i1.p1 TRINITY_DN2529_c0_g5~~TRINITY_DN2529_c0_g5_i1.p1  ORF type:complete len:255 (-),score=29.96 TRINITY_DN2529_c0_g5_i1:48-812(-)